MNKELIELWNKLDEAKQGSLHSLSSERGALAEIDELRKQFMALIDILLGEE